ncbi:hypothetical protein HU200_015332 [Digitaria exilis]|uniref:Uncharacterized protein n=1 Tax=Digitaria exilis TaxID=1010633 RepID=A0A835FB88_9POAL|nr:hypothetical protein HU200_015332 [Digitaria exilis]
MTSSRYIGSRIVKLLLERCYNYVPLEAPWETLAEGYVIDAAAVSGTVLRVVLTSSIGADTMDPNRSPDAVVDESCWSDIDFCKNTNAIMQVTSSSAAVLTVADVIVVRTGTATVLREGGGGEGGVGYSGGERCGAGGGVVPGVVMLGPALQPSVNVSQRHVLKYLDGSVSTFANAVHLHPHLPGAQRRRPLHLMQRRAPQGGVVRVLRRFWRPDRSVIGARLVGCMHLNQAGGMQVVGDWMAARAPAVYETVICFQEKTILPLSLQVAAPSSLALEPRPIMIEIPQRRGDAPEAWVIASFTGRRLSCYWIWVIYVSDATRQSPRGDSADVGAGRGMHNASRWLGGVGFRVHTHAPLSNLPLLQFSYLAWPQRVGTSMDHS